LIINFLQIKIIMKNSKTQREQYYGDYLGLDKILEAQFPESEARGVDAHDEMLFIIIHQAYELWFKQMMHELNSIMAIFENPQVDDNAPSMQTAAHRLGRMVEIWKLLVQQVDVLDTMTPMDFLDFRDLLTPASGFQSYQFRCFEARLGLRMEHRFAKEYYQKQLRDEHLQQINEVEQEVSLFDLVERWLTRMPFWAQKYWGDTPEFWQNYRAIFQSGLSGGEAATISMAEFDDVFLGTVSDRQMRLSPEACRSALFINLYREYPLLQLPFQFLGKLLEMDELMSTWRYRHWIMVRRMIGMRSGTGGSSGAGYLKGAMESHQIFKDLSRLATYFVPRQKLPKLPAELVKHLSFNQ
jgi:tryptophan 2,3-dioxygenase